METQVTLAECLIERQMLSSDEMERVSQAPAGTASSAHPADCRAGSSFGGRSAAGVPGSLCFALDLVEDQQATPLSIDPSRDFGEFFEPRPWCR